MTYYYSFGAIILGTFITVLVAEYKINPLIPYCFHYTWIGPRYTNTSEFANATCSDATRGEESIPCREPLVVSYDGSRPDVGFIWQYHAEQASCPLTGTDVCISYAYLFDGNFENSTHMCAQAVDENGKAITNGCYEAVNGGRKIKVCVCRSFPGSMPCNSVRGLSANQLTVYTLTIIIALLWYAKSA